MLRAVYYCSINQLHLPCMKKFLLLPFILAATACMAQLTVATYNIRNSNAADGPNNWELRRDTLVALVKQINPDILGTQEVLNDQLKYLTATLTGYTAYGAGRNNGRHAGEHSAIFFKKDKYELVKGGNFWLSLTPKRPGSKSWDAAITRICTWVKLKDKTTGAQLLVFNTHFDHRGKEARRQSAALLRRMVDSLAAGLPVLVTGDFNFGPDDAAYYTMGSSNYKVGLTDSYTPGALPYTDCGFEVSNQHCSRIDYIWYSSHWQQQGYKVYTNNNGTFYPSDHLPVSAVFKPAR